jgi:hypothetical protein
VKNAITPPAIAARCQLENDAAPALLPTSGDVATDNGRAVKSSVNVRQSRERSRSVATALKVVKGYILPAVPVVQQAVCGALLPTADVGCAEKISRWIES